MQQRKIPQSIEQQAAILEPLCSGLVAKIISIFSTQRILMNIQQHSAICGCMFFSGAMHFEQQYFDCGVSRYVFEICLGKVHTE